MHVLSVSLVAYYAPLSTLSQFLLLAPNVVNFAELFFQVKIWTYGYLLERRM